MNTTEQNLIPLIDKEFSGEFIKTISARELHQFLEISEKFADWIKRQLEKSRLVEKRDYICISEKSEISNRPLIEYYLTLRSAEHVSMMSNTEKGYDIREYFITCEEKLKELQKLDIPSYQIEDPVKRAKKWIEEQKEKQVLQLQNQEQQKVIEIQKPKAEYFDALVDRILLTNFRNTAKEFKVHQNELIDFLIQKHYIFRDLNGVLLPYQKYVSTFFELKEWKNFNNKVGVQTLITPRGRETFRLLINIK